MACKFESKPHPTESESKHLQSSQAHKVSEQRDFLALLEKPLPALAFHLQSAVDAQKSLQPFLQFH
jgi:hypothetical protein